MSKPEQLGFDFSFETAQEMGGLLAECIKTTINPPPKLHEYYAEPDNRGGLTGFSLETEADESKLSGLSLNTFFHFIKASFESLVSASGGEVNAASALREVTPGCFHGTYKIPIAFLKAFFDACNIKTYWIFDDSAGSVTVRILFEINADHDSYSVDNLLEAAIFRIFSIEFFQGAQNGVLPFVTGKVRQVFPTRAA